MKSLPPEIDAIDRRILEELRKDGRLAMVDLADKVGLSPTPCQRRVKQMEEAGIIVGYTTQISPAAIGRGLQAFVQVTLQDHSEERVAAFQRALGGAARSASPATS